MIMSIKLDEIDIKILNILKGKARISNRKIASMTGISVPTVGERIKRMEINGIIKGYTVIVGDESDLLEFLIIGKWIDGRKNGVKLEKIKVIDEKYTVTGKGDTIISVKINNKEELGDLIEELNKIKFIVIDIYPVISHNTNVKSITAGRMRIKCSYCDNNITGNVFKLKTVNGTRFFCCNTCREGYIARYIEKK